MRVLIKDKNDNMTALLVVQATVVRYTKDTWRLVLRVDDERSCYISDVEAELNNLLFCLLRKGWLDLSDYHVYCTGWL